MLKTNKKILTIGLIIATFTLSGCFNFGGGNNNNTNKNVASDQTHRIVDEADFQVVIPKDWEIIEPKDFTSDVPTETALVLRNNVKNEDFTSNVNVVKKELQNTQDTSEFAKEVINRQKNGLVNYKQSKNDSYKISIGGQQVDSFLNYFEGQKDANSDDVKFIQTYAVKGNIGYIITAAYSTKENDNNIKTVEDIVKSFSVK